MPIYTNTQPQSPGPIHQSPHDTYGRIHNYPSMNYYPQTQQSSHYMHHPGPGPQSLAPRSAFPVQYQPSPHLQQHQSHPNTPNTNSSPTRAIVQAPTPVLQQPKYSPISSAPPSFGGPLQGSMQPPSQTSPGSAQNVAAPGPIPATTPLITKQDKNGVQWISFEYSKDRIKVPYEIRCDVEAVEVSKLPNDHKDQNCIYPRARNRETYTGNRFQYENECNEVGWALAWLNPTLKSKRGLIQRAVDSWRNSNRDQKLRSRRVRRLAKNQKRNVAQQQINARSDMTGPNPVTSPVKREFPSMSTPTQTGPIDGVSHHHHLTSENASQSEQTRPSGTSDVLYKNGPLLS